MVSKIKLMKIIVDKFPKIRHVEDYAEVILRGWQLEALDRDSAKRSKVFFENRKIKKHAFTQCHKKMNLLIKIDDNDYNVSPVSKRELVVFNFRRAQEILDLEKSLLLKHISDNDKVKKLATKALKIPDDSSNTAIRRILDAGNIFKQGSVYEKIFNAIEDQKIKSNGYLWFGIRPIPVPNFYLSTKALGWIRDIS